MRIKCNIIIIQFIFVLLLSSFVGCKDKADTEKLILGKDFAEQELELVLSGNSFEHNVINNESFLISDSSEAITFVEPLLFKKYGKKSIIADRPYEAFLIDKYWIISGTIPKDCEGGSFLIIFDARNCEILRLTHFE